MGQMLFTQDGSAVEVEQVWVVSARQDTNGQWIQMGGKVALMPNGAYCHGDGNLLPFESKEEIRLIFASLDKEGNPCILPEMEGLLANVLEWFDHRHEFEGKDIQRVILNSKGWPELEDGTPASREQIYNYFEAGTMALEAAIVGLHERHKAEIEAQRATKPDIYQPAPPPGQTKVAGDVAAKPNKGGRKPWTKAQLADRRAKEAAKKADKASAKATPNPTAASQPAAAAE